MPFEVVVFKQQSMLLYCYPLPIRRCVFFVAHAGITVLLAFSVFMLAVAENLPETSEFVPLISKAYIHPYFKMYTRGT